MTAINEGIAVAEAQNRSNGSVATAVAKPVLLFFYSQTSGASRRAEGFLAQVLQRRRNHETFALRRVDCAARPDLVARFGIERPPALVVVEDRCVRVKLEQPRGCVEIQTLLAPWLN
jgi:thioredoxin-like negative regulator of GroEL